jgi:hypothetical protein
MKYMDMYYYAQNYQQLTNQLLYTAPIYQLPQPVYPPFNAYQPQTAESFYPPTNPPPIFK